MPSFGSTAGMMASGGAGGSVVGSAVVNLILNNALPAGFAKAETSMNSFGQKMTSAGAKMSMMGAALTRNVTLPIAAISAVSIKMASDFETAMLKASAIGGVAHKNLAGMTQEMLTFGAKS